jgi:hypothetical protein
LENPNRSNKDESENLTKVNVFHEDGAHKCQNINFDLAWTTKFRLPGACVVFIVRHYFQMVDEQPIRKEKQQNKLNDQRQHKRPAKAPKHQWKSEVDHEKTKVQKECPNVDDDAELLGITK